MYGVVDGGEVDGVRFGNPGTEMRTTKKSVLWKVWAVRQCSNGASACTWARMKDGHEKDTFIQKVGVSPRHPFSLHPFSYSVYIYVLLYLLSSRTTYPHVDPSLKYTLSIPRF